MILRPSRVARVLILSLGFLLITALFSGRDQQPSGRANGQTNGPPQSEAAEPAGERGDDESTQEVPFAPILLELAVIIGVAMLGRWLAESFQQSAVLGELVIGVLVGNIGFWLGIPLSVMVMHLLSLT